MASKVVDTNDANAAPPPNLSKKQRGRLKKLRKRASEEREGCETSGITNMSDWVELQELTSKITDDAPTHIGPSVRQRKYIDSQNAEGSHHRDIMFQSFERTNQSKKRTRDEISANIPPWATLHNSSCMQSLAVVEIDLEECKGDGNWNTFISNSLPILEKRKGVVPATTRWFQGPHPKSITDSLMYFHASPPKQNLPSSSKKEKQGDGSASMTDHTIATTIAGLEELVLTANERAKEGYPVVATRHSASSEGAKTSDASGSIENSAKIPTLAEAKKCLDIYRVALVPRGEGVDEGTKFVSTVKRLDVKPRVFAVDCEMVNTAAGQELARITLIQLDKVEDGKMLHTVVLDELAKPLGPVLDYVTRYSGITAQMLNPVETRLEQIQAFLVQLMNSEDILVGHSLENDLRAVCLAHDKVVDSSVLFRGNNNRKFSLKHLTACLLKRKIQDGADGHCSEEDAVASLELAVRRLQEGSSFRIAESNEKRLHLLESLRPDSKPIVCIGPSDWLRKHVTPFSTSAHALACEVVEDDSRKALTAWLVNPKRRAKLAWAHLRACSHDSLKVVNKTITDLLERSLPGTLILIALQGGLQHAQTVSKERKARMNPRSSLGWTEEDNRRWEESTGSCRSGYVVWMGT